MAALVTDQKRLYYVFSAGIPQRYNHRRQFERAFRTIDFHGLVDHEYLPEADHTFSDESQRDTLEEDIVSWMRLRFPIQMVRN
jgi:hypothetical protein